MEQINCKICSRKTSLAFTHKLLNKYLVKYYTCSECDFLFTENPYWFDEAYKDPINIYDTGILMRNIYFSKIVSTVLYLYFNKEAKYLDYAGGYGVFTRLMRDIGFDFYWHDDFSQNIFSRGFEMKSDCEKYELLTAFEVFEHLVNPLFDIEKMLNLSENIIFSTVTTPAPIPQTNWWYYGFEHGQHISFYSNKTLHSIASKFGMNLYRFNNLYLMTKRKFNPYKLKLLNFAATHGLDYYVRLRMTSLTETDSNKMRILI